jgi:glycerol-3-phosphate acyltransferase PlsX
MRIVLDAMGSDTHPDPEIEAAVEATTLWEDTIVLTGPKDILQQKLDAYDTSTSRIEIEHAPEVLEMTDKPAEAARGKALNSMAVGMELLKDNKADVFVTAGNTGGAMANALFRLGRIRGVKRPAVTPIIPVMGGQAVVLDVGANADCKPIYMIQFAIMGTIYAEKLLGISSPRVGLLSNGEEPGKGNMLVKETYPLLEDAGVNFIGNVEPKEVFAGEVDVVVTDGFSGNVFIKTSEAVASFMSRIIRSEITSSPISSVGGLLVRPVFKRIGTMLDPSEHGAAILLGVDGLVFIGHGRSDAKALVSAIRVAREAVLSGLLEATREAIQTRLTQSSQKETT